MATRLTKPLLREVEINVGPQRRAGSLRPLIVKLSPEGVMVREKGTRTWFGPLSYGSLYLRCAEVQAYELRRAKAERRKQRKAR